MRKKITAAFIILFLLPAGHSLYAQQKFSVGIQGGLGVAFTENSYRGGNEYTTDVILGIPKVYPVLSHMYNLYFSYRMNNVFGIALEPGIIRKGYGGKRVLEEGDVLFDRRQIEYLQLPLLLEFSLTESVQLMAGPEFGYLLDKKMRTTHDSKPAVLTDLPKNDRFDFGIQVGGYYTLMKHLDVGIKVGASFTGGDKYYLTNDAGEVLTKVYRKNCYANSFIRVKL
jgi:hypothetical protein